MLMKRSYIPRNNESGGSFWFVPLWVVFLLLSCSGCSEDWKGLCLVDQVLDLSGTWKIRFDAADKGKSLQWMHAAAWKSGESLLDIPVPAAWETLPEGAGYDGVAWYMRMISLPPDLPSGASAILRFDAVNYGATVYLNGREAVYHEGAYAGFEVPLPQPEPGAQYLLVVRVADPGQDAVDAVDGMTLEEIPHSKESWYYNYGGIIGDVRLLIQGRVHLKDTFAAITDPSG
ncbi:MAG: sugar-binding domain-containing protein, partial [Planctomycetota bacterium]